MGRKSALVALVVLVLVLGALAWLWLPRAGSSARGPTIASQPSPSRQPSRPPARPLAAPVQLVPAEAVGAAPDEPCRFEGVVLSSTSGRPVGGAQLTFEHQGAHLVQAQASGEFTFSPNADGEWQLASITAPGFLPFAPEWGQSPVHLTAARGRRLQGLKLYLTPAVDYRGLVLSPDGEPVAGAQVVLLGSEPGDDTAASFAPYVSDEKGEFVFHAADGAILEARKAGFAPGRARLDFAAEVSHRLAVRLGALPPDGGLSRSAMLSGVVVDDKDVPIPGAWVLAEYVPDNRALPGADLHPWAQAATDSQGAFALRELDSGRYRLTASAQGLAATQQLADTGASPVRLVLLAGGKVIGRVVGPTGQPVAAFTVALFRTSGVERHPVRTLSQLDPAGRFAIEDVPSGPVVLVAAASGLAPSEELSLEVVVGKTATVEVKLSEGGRLQGRVRQAGTLRPLEGARATLEGTVQAGAALPVLSSAYADAEGRFELSGLMVGRRSILVAAAGHDGRLVAGLEMENGKTLGPIEIELQPVEPGQTPKLELVGIGAVLTAQKDVLVIGRVFPGGGAAEAGLVSGDAVLAIDGTPVSSLGFDGSIQRIRGPEGTQVVLRLRRAGGQQLDLAVTRRRIKA